MPRKPKISTGSNAGKIDIELLEKASQEPMAPENVLPAAPVAPSPALSKAANEFEYLFKLFNLYSTIQVQADTVYYYRTSVITLTEGLLFVGYQSMLKNSIDNLTPLAFGIAIIGLLLSVLWLLYEQRNAAYFSGRACIIEQLESELQFRKGEANAAFVSFWSEVPKWVRENAAWYQKVSGPLIIRFLVPALFLLSWLLVLIATPYLVKPVLPPVIAP